MKTVVRITAPNGDTLHLNGQYIYELYVEHFEKGPLERKLSGKWKVEIQ